MINNLTDPSGDQTQLVNHIHIMINIEWGYQQRIMNIETDQYQTTVSSSRHQVKPLTTGTTAAY